MVTSSLVGCRGMRARRLFLELLQQHLAAVRIQAAVRGHTQRQRYLHTLAAVVTLQMGLRRWQVSLRVAKGLTEVCPCLPAHRCWHGYYTQDTLWLCLSAVSCQP